MTVRLLQTAINHRTEVHCCGCWNILYDFRGLGVTGALVAKCNECGDMLDLLPLLSAVYEKSDSEGRTEWAKRTVGRESDHAFVGGYEIDPTSPATCQICGKHASEHVPGTPQDAATPQINQQ